MKKFKLDTWAKGASLLLAVVILVVMFALRLRDGQTPDRTLDLPPTIDFTWTPAEPTSLREMSGLLAIHDDFALDFTSYRMKIVELDRTLDLPIPGLVGKDYEQPISLSLVADDPRFAAAGKATLEFTITDDKGQRTTVTKTVELKK